MFNTWESRHRKIDSDRHIDNTNTSTFCSPFLLQAMRLSAPSKFSTWHFVWRYKSLQIYPPPSPSCIPLSSARLRFVSYFFSVVFSQYLAPFFVVCCVCLRRESAKCKQSKCQRWLASGRRVGVPGGGQKGGEGCGGCGALHVEGGTAKR